MANWLKFSQQILVIEFLAGAPAFNQTLSTVTTFDDNWARALGCIQQILAIEFLV